MEDWIYYIILIGWVGFSIVKSVLGDDADKKKQAVPPVVETASLDEAVPVPDVAPLQEPVADEKNPFKTINSLETSKRTAENREIIPGVAKLSCEDKMSHEAPEKNNVDRKVLLKTKSEAKRAFVYSEIFNRKY